MKIMLLNDYLIEGGTEIYLLNLAKILEREKNEIKIITFDSEFENKISNYEIDSDKIVNIKVKSKLSKLIFEKNLYVEIRKYIEQFNPDKIIVNNLFSSPITQYKALEGYEAYQIVHDYHFLCPKSTLVKENYEICTGINKEKCLKECKYHNSKLKLCLKYNQTKKLESIRKKYIKKFIAPSECLTKYLCENNYNTVCINNPINMDKFDNQFNINELGEKRKIVYVGMINERKGIFKFLRAVREYKKLSNIQIEIIGQCSTDDDEKILNGLLTDNIKYLGKKQNTEVLEILKSSQFMVVPSLWMENYPTTVIEGMLTGNFILGSNRGGIPNMLSNDKGLLFDIIDKASIFKVLDKVLEMTQEEYSRIVKKSYEYTIVNNSYGNYYEKILLILK